MATEQERNRSLAEAAERDVRAIEQNLQSLEALKLLYAEAAEDICLQANKLQVQIGDLEIRLTEERKALDAARITAQAARAVVME
jgi:predicted transcriptional regulator